MKFRLEGFPLYLLLSLVGLGILLAAVVYLNRGAEVRLEGGIQKVRTLAIDDQHSIAVVDFRFVNPARYPFAVSNVTLICETAAGNRLEGRGASAQTVRQLFEYKSLELGPQYNQPLALRTWVKPGQWLDAMAVGAFDLPETELLNRRRFVVRVQEVDGAVSELPEKR